MSDKRKPAVPVPPFKASASVNLTKSPRNLFTVPTSPATMLTVTRSPMLNLSRSPNMLSVTRSPRLPSSARELLPFPQSVSSSTSELDKLRSQLEILEKGLSDAKIQISKQTAQLSAALLKNKQMETEIAKLKKRERICKSIETQTVPPPVPIRIQPRSRLVNKENFHVVPLTNTCVPLTCLVDTKQLITPPETVKSVSHEVFVVPSAPISPKTTVGGSHCAHQSSPRGSVRNSPIRTVQGLASKFGVVKRPVSSGNRKSITSHSGTAAKLLLSQLDLDDPATVQSVYESFDRLDGTKTGWLSRDVCLVMLSLLLEEKGIRHFSIPKVICSRMLKSVLANSSRLSDPQSPRGTVLRRDQATDFVRAALEFIIDQEKVGN